MAVSSVVTSILGPDLPFRVEAFDGSSAGPPGASLTVRILSPEAVARLFTRPGELGLARAYVAGDIDVEGDLDPLFELEVPPPMALVRRLPALVNEAGLAALRPLPPPAAETRQHGALHSRARDRRAVTHHYDVSNRFYELVLGPSMTYSCAVFESPDDSLEDAQIRKVDLIARKLDLGPGMRLLDVGSGWGTMAIHAARTFGASAVGVTLSEPQQRYATERARQAGVGDLVEFRVQDFRDVRDGPFDAISSIGMFEHVGRRSMDLYTRTLWRLLRPGGRMLNHAIGRPAVREQGLSSSSSTFRARQLAVAAGLRNPSKIRSKFIDRYVFPDGELHEVGTLVSMFQAWGFEVRHLESLREHYGITLRRWVANLVRNFDEATKEAGSERARVWRLYMAGSAVGFERHQLEVHQVLCVRPEHGRSHMPLRPVFEPVVVPVQAVQAEQTAQPVQAAPAGARTSAVRAKQSG